MTDVAVIGGGPAGCAAAITLARHGRDVTLLERSLGTKEGFCGEFLSPDGVGSLETLGALDEVLASGPVLVSKWSVLGASQVLRGSLPAPALGISRGVLDPTLRSVARQCGVEVTEGAQARSVGENAAGGFKVALSTGESVSARHVVGAMGRSARIPGLNADSEQGPREYVAFKAHFRGFVPPNEIRLFPLNGTYVGVGPIEGDAVNLCYLARREAYEAAGATPEAVLDLATSVHPEWERCWKGLERVSERWLSTGGLFFRPRTARRRPGIALCGDAAGLVSPFLGEGMSMALEAGTLAAEVIHRRFDDSGALADEYARAWSRSFSTRMRWGERLQRLLLSDRAELALGWLRATPALPRAVVNRTRSAALTDRGARALEQRGLAFAS